ncbi:hypothetical protein [uncultured Microscilla sp.]|uniref:hypothetical protein n=1 Tax=uncultured Microscilla sp. TaxID=432653 RepID=UPI0026333625|nr:hypothetical protein [uncultured Microscilla sp.]
MKKTTTYLVAIIAAVALLTACGEGTNNTKNQQTDADTSVKTSSETPNKNTEATNNTKPVKTISDDKKGEGTKANNTQEAFVEGVFQEIEQGDLFHFIIKDAQSKTHDFWVFKPDATYQTIEADQAKYKGRKIKVFYKKTKKYIENAGGEIAFEEYVKAEL